jgi:large subunit ribosomal protein L1
MRRRSRRYQKDVKDYDSKSKLSLAQAIAKLKEWDSAKFKQSVDCVMWLGIDARQADQAIRGAMTLPHGIGKTLRVIAFCEGEDAEKAKEAGAIEVGDDELVKKVADGWLDFDVAIAHPRLMGKVGKLGRVLGPQGKMPSPKSGTVTADIGTAVKEYAAGKVEFRNDSGGNVHATVGKVNFEVEKLEDNINAFIDQIKKMKPSSTKGHFIKKVSLSATMSPSIELVLA